MREKGRRGSNNTPSNRFEQSLSRSASLIVESNRPNGLLVGFRDDQLSLSNELYFGRTSSQLEGQHVEIPSNVASKNNASAKIRPVQRETLDTNMKMVQNATSSMFERHAKAVRAMKSNKPILRIQKLNVFQFDSSPSGRDRKTSGIETHRDNLSKRLPANYDSLHQYDEISVGSGVSHNSNELESLSVHVRNQIEPKPASPPLIGVRLPKSSSDRHYLNQNHNHDNQHRRHLTTEKSSKQGKSPFSVQSAAIPMNHLDYYVHRARTTEPPENGKLIGGAVLESNSNDQNGIETHDHLLDTIAWKGGALRIPQPINDELDDSEQQASQWTDGSSLTESQMIRDNNSRRLALSAGLVMRHRSMSLSETRKKGLKGSMLTKAPGTQLADSSKPSMALSSASLASQASFNASSAPLRLAQQPSYLLDHLQDKNALAAVSRPRSRAGLLAGIAGVAIDINAQNPINASRIDHVSSTPLDQVDGSVYGDRLNSAGSVVTLPRVATPKSNRAAPNNATGGIYFEDTINSSASYQPKREEEFDILASPAVGGREGGVLDGVQEDDVQDLTGRDDTSKSLLDLEDYEETYSKRMEDSVERQPRTAGSEYQSPRSNLADGGVLAELHTSDVSTTVERNDKLTLLESLRLHAEQEVGPVNERVDPHGNALSPLPSPVALVQQALLHTVQRSAAASPVPSPTNSVALSRSSIRTMERNQELEAKRQAVRQVVGSDLSNNGTEINFRIGVNGELYNGKKLAAASPKQSSGSIGRRSVVDVADNAKATSAALVASLVVSSANNSDIASAASSPSRAKRNQMLGDEASVGTIESTIASVVKPVRSIDNISLRISAPNTPIPVNTVDASSSMQDGLQMLGRLLDNDVGSHHSEDAASSVEELPYQVHRRIMGWKLTNNARRRKDLIGLLDIVHNKNPVDLIMQNRSERKISPSKMQNFLPFNYDEKKHRKNSKTPNLELLNSLSYNRSSPSVAGKNVSYYKLDPDPDNYNYYKRTKDQIVDKHSQPAAMNEEGFIFRHVDDSDEEILDVEKSEGITTIHDTVDARPSQTAGGLESTARWDSKALVGGAYRATLKRIRASSRSGKRREEYRRPQKMPPINLVKTRLLPLNQQEKLLLNQMLLAYSERPGTGMSAINAAPVVSNIERQSAAWERAVNRLVTARQSYKNIKSIRNLMEDRAKSKQMVQKQQHELQVSKDRLAQVTNSTQSTATYGEFCSDHQLLQSDDVAQSTEEAYLVASGYRVEAGQSGVYNFAPVPDSRMRRRERNFTTATALAAMAREAATTLTEAQEYARDAERFKAVAKRASRSGHRSGSRGRQSGDEAFMDHAAPRARSPPVSRLRSPLQLDPLPPKAHNADLPNDSEFGRLEDSVEKSEYKHRREQQQLENAHGAYISTQMRKDAKYQGLFDYPINLVRTRDRQDILQSVGMRAILDSQRVRRKKENEFIANFLAAKYGLHFEQQLDSLHEGDKMATENSVFSYKGYGYRSNRSLENSASNKQGSDFDHHWLNDFDDSQTQYQFSDEYSEEGRSFDDALKQYLPDEHEQEPSDSAEQLAEASNSITSTDRNSSCIQNVDNRHEQADDSAQRTNPHDNGTIVLSLSVPSVSRSEKQSVEAADDRDDISSIGEESMI